MARPREFDMDEVLDALMRVFWDRGYLGTSLRDVERATGLTRGSLYKVFEDKEQMFLLAMARYASLWTQALEALASASSPRSGLRAFLMHWISASLVGDTPRGCLLVKVIGEEAFEEEVIRECVMQITDRVMAGLEEAIARGVQAGEFSQVSDPRRAARHLFYSVVVGARVAARHGVARDDLALMVEDSLVSLG